MRISDFTHDAPCPDAKKWDESEVDEVCAHHSQREAVKRDLGFSSTR